MTGLPSVLVGINPKGTTMSDKKFTMQEVQYLLSLDVVSNATPNRIIYADTFKRKCLERYSKGESPTKIFREAGLPPELIGYKRIERAFSRWKDKKAEILRNAALADADESETATQQYDSEVAQLQSIVAGQSAILPSSAAQVPVPGVVGSAAPDIRDMLIIQQIHRIAELEHRIETLKTMLHEGTAADEQESDNPAQ